VQIKGDSVNHRAKIRRKVQDLVLLGVFVEKLQMFQEFCHILTDGLAFQTTPLWFEDEVQKHNTHEIL
jgi:hypothetical protein